MECMFVLASIAGLSLLIGLNALLSRSGSSDPDVYEVERAAQAALSHDIHAAKAAWERQKETPRQAGFLGPFRTVFALAWGVMAVIVFKSPSPEVFGVGVTIGAVFGWLLFR